jgi:hypothetical protein
MSNDSTIAQRRQPGIPLPPPVSKSRAAAGYLSGVRSRYSDLPRGTHDLQWTHSGPCSEALQVDYMGCVFQT